MFSWSRYHARAACVVAEELDLHFGTHVNRLTQPQCPRNKEAASCRDLETCLFFTASRVLVLS